MHTYLKCNKAKKIARVEKKGSAKKEALIGGSARYVKRSSECIKDIKLEMDKRLDY